MIVVSNTSPLTNLAAIGHFELLRQLFGEVAIADGVWAELNALGRRWPGAKEVEEADWIHRYSINNQALVTALRRDLERGEAESIALALDLKSDLLLLDEKEGRRAAQRLGLRVAGVVGVLITAKARNEIENVRPLLDSLRLAAGFYLSDDVYQQALRLSNE